MKKRFTLILLSAVALFLGIFWRNTLSVIADVYIHASIKQQLGASFTRGNVSYEKGYLSIEDVSIKKEENGVAYTLKSQKVHIQPKWSDGALQYHVRLFSPDLVVKKHPGGQFFSTETALFEGIFFEIDEGSFCLEDLVKEQKCSGKMQQIAPFAYQISCHQSTASIRYFTEKGAAHWSLDLVNMDLADGYFLADFFLEKVPYIASASGKATGSIHMKKRPLEKKEFFGEYHIDDLELTSCHQRLKAKEVFASFSYPVKSASSHSPLVEAFFAPIANAKCAISFHESTLSSLKAPLLQDMDIQFSYHPEVGPKLYAKAVHQVGPIALEGRGYFHSTKQNWMDVTCFFGEQPIFLQAKEKGDAAICLEGRCTRFSHEKLDVLRDLFSSFYPTLEGATIQEGKTTLDLKAYVDHGEFKDIVVNKAAIENLSFHLPKKDIYCRAKKIFFKGSYDLSEKNGFSSLFSTIDIEEGNLLYRGVEIAQVQSGYSEEKGYILPSKCVFSIEGLENHIEVTGPIDECSLTSMVQGNTRRFFSKYISHEEEFSEEISATISIKKKKDEALVFGSLQIAEEDISFGLDVVVEPIHLCKVHSGWMRAKDIDLAHYAPFFSGTLFKGKADVSMQYQKLRAHFDLIGSDYAFRMKGVELLLGDTANLSFSYDFSDHTWDCDALLHKASLMIDRFSMRFEDIEGPFSIRQNFLQANQLAFTLEEIEGALDVYLDFRDQVHLDVFSSVMQGNLSSVSALCNRAGISCKLPLKGAFAVEKEGCYISTDFVSDTKWGVSANISGGKTELTSQVSIEDVQAIISYHSDPNQEVEGSMEATCKLGDKTYALSMPSLYREAAGSIAFDLRLEDAFWDILRLKGTCSYEKDRGFALDFTEENVEVFGEKCAISSALLDEHLRLKSGQLAVEMPLSLVEKRLSFFLPLFSCRDLDVSNLFPCPVKGAVKTVFRLTDQGAEMDLKGENLQLGKKTFSSFLLHAAIDEKKWVVDQCVLDDFSTSFSWEYGKGISAIELFYDQESIALFDVQEKEPGAFSAHVQKIALSTKHLDLLLPWEKALSGAVLASGYASFRLPQKEKKPYFDLDLDIEPETLVWENTWECHNLSQIHVSYSLEKGLLITGLDFSAVSPTLDRDDLRCQIGSIAYDKGEYFLHDVSFYVPQDGLLPLVKPLGLPPLLEARLKDVAFARDVNILADVHIEETGKKLSCTLSELSIPIGEDAYRFENVTCLLADQLCSCECFLPLGEEFYRLKLLCDTFSPMKGSLSFFELESEELPLTISWETDVEGNLVCSRIQGVFSGIDASFHPGEEPAALFGGVKLDFSKVRKIFSPRVYDALSSYDIGSGYELRGKLTLDTINFNYNFSGLFSGKQFEAMGYAFKTLLSQVTFTKDAFACSDVKISDSSGIIKVEKIVCEKEEEDWYLKAPHISLEEFRPSLLREIGRKLRPVQPLVVRKMDIEDFTLNFSDPTSCRAKGKLSFINSFKRGHSIFDIPADIIGRIFGLDLELLIPVRGNLSFIVDEGKVVFTDLEDSFSEGGRSQFFLAKRRGDLPYMDLNGDLHVYIKMKQFVLFKFTENFIISINGKLDNPKVHLQRKKRFFSS